MPRNARLLCTIAIAASLSLAAVDAQVGIHARKATPSTNVTPFPAPLTAQERTLHMLDRFTFGPRPQDAALVTQAGGPEVWFERQLNPASIHDDVLDQRLAQYPALDLSPSQLLYNFPPRHAIKQIAEGKKSMPTDPMLAALYETLLVKYKARAEVKQAKQTSAGSRLEGSVLPVTTAPSGDARDASAEPDALTLTDAQRMAKRKQDAVAAQRLAAPLLPLAPAERMAALLRMPVTDRIVLTGGLEEPQKSEFLSGLTPRERDLYYAMSGGPDASRAIKGEQQQAKVLRAVLSERQLQEVMTDFWFNHFNVFLNKQQDGYYIASYERDAIRAHALGKFRDLLLATAQHPAMLLYLDNWQSIGPGSVAGQFTRARGKPRGLNENYGRELMELHTVGVTGGYSQADVTALAKILTGWTVDHPEEGGGFVFEPRRHEPGAKQWFGQTIHESGMAEGVKVLSWLAAQPQTAHFISYKLAQRFVADEPPPALVDRMAKSYLASDGDIKQVLRTMVRSPEFWQRAYYRNKVKTPLEFVASAFRATDTDPANPGIVVALLGRMGEPLYGMQPPTGYPMTADHWMNSAALIDRLNFSLAITHNRLPDTRFDAAHLLETGMPSGSAAADSAANAVAPRMREASASSPAGAAAGQQSLQVLERTLTGGTVSAKTDAVIRQQLAQQPADTTAQLNTIAALLLGSPEFQLR